LPSSIVFSHLPLKLSFTQPIEKSKITIKITVDFVLMYLIASPVSPDKRDKQGDGAQEYKGGRRVIISGGDTNAVLAPVEVFEYQDYDARSDEGRRERYALVARAALQLFNQSPIAERFRPPDEPGTLFVGAVVHPKNAQYRADYGGDGEYDVENLEHKRELHYLINGLKSQGVTIWIR
jgi:hypothetical protein